MSTKAYMVSFTVEDPRTPDSPRILECLMRVNDCKDSKDAFQVWRAVFGEKPVLRHIAPVLSEKVGT